MRIGIFSDTHFGFGEKTERDQEAYLQALQALQGVLEKKVDFVLLAGDLFDSNEPTPEAWKQSLDFFGVACRVPSDVKVEKVLRNGSVEDFSFGCVPVVSIHGTHEHRPKGLVNALEVLEAGRQLVHLHANYAVVSKGSDKVCVHGLSGVPEKVALDVLRQWDPKPVNGMFNILVLHQSFREFLPTDDEMSVSISLSDLPDGFSLYINGHLHWANETVFENKRFLLTGSTVATQMKRLESQKPKGFFVLDTVSGKIEFFPIPKQRRIFYEKLVFDSASIGEVSSRVKSVLDSIFSQSFEQKPLVRIKLAGSLAKGVSSADLNLNHLIADVANKGIFSVDESFSESSLRQKISELRSFQKSKASVSEMGLEILEKNLSQTNFENSFDVRQIFEWLSEGETEKAMAVLLEKKPVVSEKVVSKE